MQRATNTVKPPSTGYQQGRDWQAEIGTLQSQQRAVRSRVGYRKFPSQSEARTMSLGNGMPAGVDKQCHARLPWSCEASVASGVLVER